MSAWSKSKGRRRRGSTRSAYGSWRNRRENNELASRRLRNGSVVRKRKGECQRRKALRTGQREKREDGENVVSKESQNGVVLNVSGDRMNVRTLRSVNESQFSRGQVMGPVEWAPMTVLSAVALMKTEGLIALRKTVDLEGAWMMSVDQGGALMMIVVIGGEMMTVVPGVA